jgi:4-amino-4-deoxy-L-arabinose transferase-like glycosyltransferase
VPGPDRPTFVRWLVAVAAAGALWRLGYLAVARWGNPLPGSDALYYGLQAVRNTEGDWFRRGLTDAPGAAHGPLTVLYLTPWSLLPGEFSDWQRLGNTVLGCLTPLVLGLAGRRLAGPQAGLVAAAVAAVYPNLWINDALVMSETLAIFVASLALWAALAFDERPTLRGAAFLGLLTGLGALVRSEIALWVAGFALLAWWRHHLRAAALVVAVAGVTILPWAAYNLTRFEHPVLLTTNDGATLLGANCERTYTEELGGWSLFCLLESDLANPDADESELSAVQRDEALEFVGDHLDRVPVVVAARLGRSLDLYGLGRTVALDVSEEKPAWGAWAGIVLWWLLAPVAVVGWWATEPPRRRWLVVPVLAVLATTVLFYGAHRIRASAEPAVVLLAAAGVVRLSSPRRGGPASSR